MPTILSKLQRKYTIKQFEVLKEWLREQPRITILSGGKRAGKTYLLVLIFLLHIKKFKGKQFIIVGSNISSVKRNIISEMENYLGTIIKLDKSNSFKLFGNTITVFQGANADCWKSIRGFTSYGTLINEATAQHEDTVTECFDRTSGNGGKVFADTNTENPYHYFKKNFIDKDGAKDSNGKLQIMARNFTMFDNTFLSKEYIETQLKLYEKGTTKYLREIMGVWVAKAGVIYPMFKESKHLINCIPSGETIIKYIAGVDWGFEHYGSIVVLGKTNTGKYILVEEVAEQYKYFEFWRDKCKEFSRKYSISKFYCDSARVEYVNGLQLEGLPAMNADKRVVEGIAEVSRLLTEGKLLFIESKFKKGREEFYQYVWEGGASEKPVKLFDDVMDSIRYAVKSDIKYNSYSKDISIKPRVFQKHRY